MSEIFKPVSVGQQQLPNRIVKAAMSEAMATPEGEVTPELVSLYREWAKGGLKCSITGNVMVDRYQKNEPGVVVIDEDTDVATLKPWADLYKEYGMAQLVQLSHPGKQAPKGLNKENVAPSAIGYQGSLAQTFPVPRELTEDEIHELIKKFGVSARKSEEAGFQGIELHGAHGYLISQFLSPRHNQRTDQWGGSLENRMRFLTEIYKEVRRQTSDKFIVGVKLNSSDFQKDGFTEEESLKVMQTLNDLGADFIEVSGGTYESPAMVGVEEILDRNPAVRESTRKREAYFLEFAKQASKVFTNPLMVTGGFRETAVMNQALADNSCQLIGIARPFALDPQLVNELQAGQPTTKAIGPIKTGIGFIDNMGVLEIIWYAAQFRAIANEQPVDPDLSPLKVFAKYAGNSMKDMLRHGMKPVFRRRAK